MLGLHDSEPAASEATASVCTADTDEILLSDRGAFSRRDTHDLGVIYEDWEEVFASTRAVHELAAYGYSAAERHATAPSASALRLNVDGSVAAGDSSQRLHVAPAKATGVDHAIGSVEAVTGSVSVVRNGLTVPLHAGDPVYMGDVVQTEAGGAAKLNLTNGVALNLGHSANVVINDMPHVSVTAPVLPQQTTPLVLGSLSQIPSAPSDKPLPQAPDQGHVSFAPGSSTPPTVLAAGPGLPASGVSQSLSPSVTSTVAQAGQPSAASLNPSLVIARTDAQGEAPTSISASATSPTTSPFPGSNSSLSSSTNVFVPTELFVPAARDAAIQPAANSSGGRVNPVGSTAAVDTARGAGGISRDASDPARAAARDIGDGLGQAGRVVGDAVGNVAGPLINGAGQGGSAAGPFGNAAGAAENVAGPASISLGQPDRASGPAGNAPSAVAGGVSIGPGQAGNAAGLEGSNAAAGANGNTVGAGGNTGGALSEGVGAAAGAATDSPGRVGGATDVVGNGAGQAGDGVATAVGAIGNGVGQAGGASGEAVDAATGPASNGLGQPGNGVSTAVDAVVNGRGPAGGPEGAGRGGSGQAASAPGAAAEIVSDRPGATNDLAATTSSGAGHTDGAANAAATALGNGTGRTDAAAGALVSAADDGSTKVLEPAGNAAGTVGNTVSQAHDAEGGVIRSRAGAEDEGHRQTGSAAKAAVGAIGNGADQASGTAGSAGSNVAGTVEDVLGRAGSAEGAVGKSVGQEIDAASDGVRNGADAVGGHGHASSAAGGGSGDPIRAAASGGDQAGGTADDFDNRLCESDASARTASQGQDQAAVVDGAVAPEKGQPSTALDDAAGNPVGAASIGLGGMADAIAEVANSEARDVPSPAASTPRAGSATVSVPEVMAQAHPGAFHPDQGVSAAHEGRSAGEVLDSATSDDRFPTHPLSDAVDGPVATPTLLGTLLAASGIQTDTIDAHPQTLGNSALGAGGEATDTGSVIGAEEWVGLPAQSHKISYVEAAPDLTGANSIPNEGGGQTLAAAQDHGIPDQSGTGTATGLTDPAAGSVAGETQRTYDSKADHDSANSAEAAASADAEGTRATKMQSEEAISDSVAQTHKTVSTTIDVAIVDSQNIAALPNGTADEDEEDGKAEAVDEVEKDSSLLPEDKDKFVFPQDHGKPTDFANSEASVADPSAKYFLDVAAVDAREVDPKAHVQSIGADRHLPAPGIDAEAQTGLDGISSPDNMQVFTNHALIDSVLFA